MELTPEQKDIRNAAREFAEGEMMEVARELDEKQQFDERLWQKAADLGFLGVFVDEQYGGAGLGYLEHSLICEEFARIDCGIAHSITSTFFGAQLLSLIGTEEQKLKYLSSVCKGEAKMGVAITEPDAGSDVSSVKTTARKADGGYVISGSKTFITNANRADFLIVLCITNPEAKKKYDRFSTIIVETNRPGYEASKLKNKLSIRCSDTGEVTFKDVVVPKENLLGEEGRGFYNIMEFLNRSRLEAAGFGIGTAQGALEKAINHVRKRKQFGAPLADSPIVQTKIAEMATLVEAGRSFLYSTSAKVDRGEMDHALIAMTKWYAAEIAVKVSDEAIQLHGGYGILEEYDVSHYWRDAKVIEIFEGTKEVEKLIIGRRLLGR
ncbi:MAG TPA: acyl-CoA dehydrogenase family protein [Syntrophorhabdaceae bacterium]|nr:acyl-CoA dehydrogenase family protein [Syntrophorhabdaceae bacterium]HQM80253.1 acyl-CoA dehydrogenase family protein [Syntrophorhabdaceae bacterium]